MVGQRNDEEGAREICATYSESRTSFGCEALCTLIFSCVAAVEDSDSDQVISVSLEACRSCFVASSFFLVPRCLRPGKTAYLQQKELFIVSRECLGSVPFLCVDSSDTALSGRMTVHTASVDLHTFLFLSDFELNTCPTPHLPEDTFFLSSTPVALLGQPCSTTVWLWCCPAVKMVDNFAFLCIALVNWSLGGADVVQVRGQCGPYQANCVLPNFVVNGVGSLIVKWFRWREHELST